jgi:hypothetical protein
MSTACAAGSVPSQLVRGALAVVGLLGRRSLHLDHARIGQQVTLPDGRRFTVYRETSCDEAGDDHPVTLAVWFHLKGTVPGGRFRAWLFERESMLNTVLYAGFRGYERKLWMVDRGTGDYAGLYAWRGVDAAEGYRRYITAVLRPLATAGSVGAEVVDVALADYLGSEPPTVERARTIRRRVSSSG